MGHGLVVVSLWVFPKNTFIIFALSEAQHHGYLLDGLSSFEDKTQYLWTWRDLVESLKARFRASKYLNHHVMRFAPAMYDNLSVFKGSKF